MFIRFKTNVIDEDNNLPVGVFTLAYQILDELEEGNYQSIEIRKSLDWFKKNLAIPNNFSRSRKKHVEPHKGICWFKSDAKECMSNVRYLVQLVRDQDILVEEIKTDSPGYIVFEDNHQVVAEPFRKTPR